MELNNVKKKLMKIIDVKENMKGCTNQFRCTKYLNNNFKNINLNESQYNSTNNQNQFIVEKNDNNSNLEIINLKKNLNTKKQFYETNGLLLPNFKKTMIRLNKQKFEVIKNLYPKTTKSENKNKIIQLNKNSFKNINHSYLKYLENNKSSINKKPFKLCSSISMADLTAKNYFNYDSNNKFYKKIKEKTNNNSKNNILLPNILTKRNKIISESSNNK